MSRGVRPRIGDAGKVRPPPEGAMSGRLARLDWRAMRQSLETRGYARTEPVLNADECAELIALFQDDAVFRSRVNMDRYRLGVGDYAYFANPLPRLVRELRTHAYPHLASIANAWMEALEEPYRYPPRLAGYLERCHEAGQTLPTPLLLRYTEDGYNNLHQDLYGPLAFPLQITAFLSRPGLDYDGGAFLLVEQHPRQQSRGEAIVPAQGELLIFPSDARPAKGSRGWYRVHSRHGVSRVLGGDRYTLGIIFHDAK